MFDGIGPFDWLVIGSALALGFGMVKFMLVVGEQKRREREAERSSPAPGRAWFDVLGVPPDAPWEEIASAYEARLAQYRPEKVAGLGQEFERLAERATGEIHGAYGEALALHGRLRSARL